MGVYGIFLYVVANSSENTYEAGEATYFSNFLIVQLQEKSSIKHTCPAMQALDKVTLKGGLQAGDFTDVGKVNNLEQCYNICCQQENCDLAFMLAQNCFSVQCKDKNLCTTVPAQPSIFNPQIAYVRSRGVGSGKSVVAPAFSELLDFFSEYA